MHIPLSLAWCSHVFKHQKSECIAQAEGHYYVMVQHVFDSEVNRNVMEMWKLGGSGLTVVFQVGIALDAMALGADAMKIANMH